MNFMNHITWIRESLLRQKGVKTQYGLAAALGKTPAVITRMMNGERKLRADEIDAVAKYLNEEPPYDAMRQKNDAPQNQKRFDLPVKVADRNFPFGPDTVPILGQANASSKAVMLNFDDPIGEYPRHPNQKNVKNAYYIRVYDESMSPRYYPGELAAINGNMSPLSKKDCIVQLNNDEVYIKQFVKTTGKEVICRQLNPAREWKCLLVDIKAIHAVVGRG